MEKLLYRCYKCEREDIEKDKMSVSNGKIRNICKACRCNEEKNRRAKKTKEELKEISAKHYRTQIERFAALDEFDPEEIEIVIHRWAVKNRIRNSESKFKQRMNLDLENLKMLCYKAREIFPYITFNNKRSKDSKWDTFTWASIDRIDPTLPYRDDNILVVPLWLNSAKLDFSSYRDLFEFIDSMDRGKFLNFLDDYSERWISSTPEQYKAKALTMKGIDVPRAYKLYLSDKFKDWETRQDKRQIVATWSKRNKPEWLED